MKFKRYRIYYLEMHLSNEEVSDEEEMDLSYQGSNITIDSQYLVRAEDMNAAVKVWEVMHQDDDFYRYEFIDIEEIEKEDDTFWR